MGIEKTIKQQAREALKGNISVLIAGLLLVSGAAMLVIYLGYAVMTAFGIVDIETDELADSAAFGVVIAYYAIEFVEVLLLTLLSPLLNGALKAAANTAVSGKCSVGDLFFYFGRGMLYGKTVVLNLLLFLIWSLLTSPLRAVVEMRPFDGSEAADFIYWVGVAVCVIWGILVYAWFVHYPLCAYSLDSGRSVGFYAFTLIGFSFRNFGKFLKLFFSLIGWILLCFFVLPILYTAPYASVAMISSARWLLEDERKF